MLPSVNRTLALVVQSLLLSLTVQGLSLSGRATTCNGHSELCEKSYGAVSFVGAHNSYAVGVNNLAANQDQDVTQQLNDGVRLLQMQAHDKNGVIQLCHSSCTLYDGGSLEDYLKKVKTWMLANTNDVVTLLIVNINNLPATSYDTVFKAVGLDTISFAPEAAVVPASGWPTLGSMIDSGKRLVTFLDNQASFETAPYLIDEFTNIWETPFNNLDPAGFTCTVNRTKGDTATQMYLINHILNRVVFNNPAPDPARANVTNAASGPGSLGEEVQLCTSLHTRPPNFLLVDFYEFGGGSVFEVAASINGVTYNPTTPVATPSPTSSGASTTSSGSNGSNKGANGNAGVSMKSVLTGHQLAASLCVVGGIVLGAIVAA